MMRSIVVHRFTHLALLSLAPDEQRSLPSAGLELGNTRACGGQ